MRRDGDQGTLARARILLRLEGATCPRTAARRTAGRALPSDLDPTLTVVAADEVLRGRVAARAAAGAHAGRIVAVVAAGERAALTELLGEDARRFAVNRRAALGTVPSAPGAGALADDWRASCARILAAVRARAWGQADGWAAAGLNPAEAAALDLALAAERAAAPVALASAAVAA